MALIASKSLITPLYNIKFPNYNNNKKILKNYNHNNKVFAKVKLAIEKMKNKEEEEKRDFYVNSGYAIRTIRHDFPDLFYRELNFDIYRDDIVFKDPVNTFIGIENYKSIFWALRFHGRLFFRGLWLDIVNVWQPSGGVIMVRWTVHGIPRVPWESRCRFDATSEYKLDKFGKIYEHQVHNIALNSPPKFRVLSMDELIRSVSCPSTPKPTYFEFFPSWIKEFVPLLVKLTLVRVVLTRATFCFPRPEGESSKNG